jgi:hypothetical protein
MSSHKWILGTRNLDLVTARQKLGAQASRLDQESLDSQRASLSLEGLSDTYFEDYG